MIFLKGTSRYFASSFWKSCPRRIGRTWATMSNSENEFKIFYKIKKIFTLKILTTTNLCCIFLKSIIISSTFNIMFRFAYIIPAIALTMLHSSSYLLHTPKMDFKIQRRRLKNEICTHAGVNWFCFRYFYLSATKLTTL